MRFKGLRTRTQITRRVGDHNRLQACLIRAFGTYKVRNFKTVTQVRFLAWRSYSDLATCEAETRDRSSWKPPSVNFSTAPLW